MQSTSSIVDQCRAASLRLATLTGDQRNQGLQAISESLQQHKDAIIEANQKDLTRGKLEQVAPPLMKRLIFGSQGIDQVCTGIRSTMQLVDPLGKTLSARELDKGLNLYQVTVPLGVVAMIFEARPDALIQIATLALKSGNGIILKGGSEARESNQLLARIVHDAAVSAGIPSGWLGLIESREGVQELLTQNGKVDLIIPRGSNQFVQYIMRNTTIPVLGHADGICHTYIDRGADPAMAVSLVVDSKTNYPAACNATETILIHRDSQNLIEPIIEALQKSLVEVRCCAEICNLFPNRGVILATEDDWKTEYVDTTVSIKLVESLKQGVDHINTYGSKHTDAIITEDRERVDYFMNHVDSANLFHNCSTRFSDGFRYGFGAEVGISTSKIHARGPVGIQGLVTYTWRLFGSGQVVADYSSGAKHFTHRELV